MNFKYSYDEPRSHVYFAQENMEKSTMHLGIEVYDEKDEFIRDWIMIYMSPEEAQRFIDDFQKSLDVVQRKKR